MKLIGLQAHLKETGRYSGKLDGKDGMLTEGGVMLALTDGPDTAVTLGDMAIVAAKIGVQAAAIRAFWKIEANGAGFLNGRPKILPEPHRFSRNTAHAFDADYPKLSYPKWGARPYPADQDARYRMLLDWVALLAGRDMPLDAAFASASYGAPQIMGENAALCGYADPFSFAEAMARDEKTQLDAFVSFVDQAGILPDLRRVDRTVASWQPVAKRYNGTAFALNQYDSKMAGAFAAFGGK